MNSLPAPRRLPDTRGPVRVTWSAFATLLVLVFARGLVSPAAAETAFRFPTENEAMLQPGNEAKFFAPTAGRTWTAGQFGCVRSDGTQMHEGVDILALKHDRRGEPLDEVHAAAAGEVAYINRKSGLSNYGNYVVLRHTIDGLEVYTLYAHLREARRDLQPGQKVHAGETIGALGRTTNTRSSITKDRAHVHFEIDLLVNERFPAWLHKHEPEARDDHGAWNGRNLLGLDPAEVFRQQQRQGTAFNLLEHVRNQEEMCKVLVADTSFPWLKRYPRLIRKNAVAEKEGIVAYEVSLNYNGLPFRLTPRARSEIKGSVSTRILSVAETEYRQHGCRKLIFPRGQSWILTARGQELISLLTH